MDAVHLVAGLGNPGSKYSRTRHNAGFIAVEHFGKRFAASWKNEPKFQSRIARIKVAGGEVILCEPQTYMNASGEGIAPLAAFYKVERARILVLVDDADLPLGQIRLRPEGSSGGHHGLESIERHLGGRNFARQRIGIGRTRNEQEPREITGHVLGAFGEAEEKLLEKVLEQSARQVECFLVEGIQKAMSQFNGAIEKEPGKSRGSGEKETK